MKRRTLQSACTAVLLAALALASPFAADAAKQEPQPPARTPAELMQALAQPGPLPDLLVLGKDDAPVTIVEYADLSCPHCAHFHAAVLPLVKEKYIDTGKARLVFREFPLNTHSLIAFMSVRCAPQQDAQQLIAGLFARQDDWIQSRSMQELTAKLRAVGKQVGVPGQAFDGCLPSGPAPSTDREKQLVKDIVAVRDRADKEFGVNATPTFFVNGVKLPGPTIEDFDKAMTAALQK
jgi:protein-disulfide isomerase